MASRKKSSKQTIAIIGLGLMGGSLAAVCRKKFPKARIVGISRNTSALSTAKRKKWIHQSSKSVSEGVKNADLIVLCTPVNTFPKLLSKIDKVAKPKALVTDVGSVKGAVAKKLSGKKWKNIHFVSAHPMMGSHERGIKAANIHLYDEGYIFLIKSPKVPATSQRKVKNFWKKIHPCVIEMSAKDHDRITGNISHLPHVIAVCLVLSLDAKSLRFASSGFKSTTRIAQGDLSIWMPILLSNKKAVMAAMKGFQSHLSQFRTAYNLSNPSRLRALLNQAIRKRKQI